MDRAIAYLRTNARFLAAEIIVNGVLPWVIYSYTRVKLGDVNALLASMAPPIVWSIAEFVRRRRVDAVSIFIVVGIALSLLAFLGGGSAKFLQLRENLVGGIVAVAFLVSAAIGRPLIYEFARASMKRQSAEIAATFEKLNTNPAVRRSMMMMTVVWGTVMLAQTALACLLVFVLSIQVYLAVSPVIGYATIGALALWTFWNIERMKRLGRGGPSTSSG
jgi:intracellular septation protein A